MQTKGIITPRATLSFPRLWEPEAYNNGAPKYQATLVFDKGTDITALQQAAIHVAKEKWGDKAVSLIKAGKIRMPFIKVSGEAGYPEGGTFIRARSEYQPVVVRWDTQQIHAGTPEADQLIYPGAIVRGRITVYAYDRDTGKGVSVALEGIQFLDHGTRLDGRVAAKDAFDAAEAPSAVDLDDFAGEAAVEDDIDLDALTVEDDGDADLEALL